MCGEIDEQVLIGQELLDRVKAVSKKLGLPEPAVSGDAPEGLAEAQGRAAYMERVFRSGLARALDDVATADEDETIDALAAQAIALARVAGFVAGQLPAEADLYRAIIEAATSGHAEARGISEAIGEAHHHHHYHHQH